MRCDGHTRCLISDDIRRGVVIRHLNADGSCPPFSDQVICRIESDTVHLARPYVFAHLGTHLSGVETYSVCDLVKKNFHTVLLASGKAYEMKIGE